MEAKEIARKLNIPLEKAVQMINRANLTLGHPEQIRKPKLHKTHKQTAPEIYEMAGVSDD